MADADTKLERVPAEARAIQSASSLGTITAVSLREEPEWTVGFLRLRPDGASWGAATWVERSSRWSIVGSRLDEASSGAFAVVFDGLFRAAQPRLAEEGNSRVSRRVANHLPFMHSIVVRHGEPAWLRSTRQVAIGDHGPLQREIVAVQVGELLERSIDVLCATLEESGEDFMRENEAIRREMCEILVGIADGSVRSDGEDPVVRQTRIHCVCVIGSLLRELRGDEFVDRLADRLRLDADARQSTPGDSARWRDDVQRTAAALCSRWGVRRVGNRLQLFAIDEPSTLTER